MSEHPEDDAPTARAHRKPSRDRGQLALAVVTVIALAALGLAVWSLMRPAPGSSHSTSSYTDAQRKDAKAKTCAAFEVVRTGVSQNTNLQPPGGEQDTTGILAVAANARLSLVDGGQYLLARLDPATPPEVADPVRKFADGLMDIGAAAISGVQNTDPAQAARLHDADAANNTIADLCK